MTERKGNQEVRVRFAPSPTGYLHIGGARTALFNWLFARKMGGKFLLRIEDTDFERSSREMIDEILRGLEWLGLHWDEEIWFQSTRLDVYRQKVQELIENRKVYKCFCEKPGEGEEEKRPRCSCYLLTVKEQEELLAQGKKPAIRFWVPDGSTVVEDVVYGTLEFDNNEIENFVVLRADGTPTYHLAVVVDDHEMGVTHVIRGDDHLSNTPKQILLYHAFGWDLPVFAHVPLILGPDKKRLSKRHGATSISEYFQSGILPEAMVNYLALLGWSPGDNREIMSVEELIEAFSLEGISRKSAVFDPVKLEWVNSEHIKRCPTEELIDKVVPFLIEADLLKKEEILEKRSYLYSVLELFKTRMKTLRDLAKYGRYFFRDPERYDPNALKKYWEKETPGYLRRLRKVLEEVDVFSVENVEKATRELAAELGVPAAKLIHPTRIVLTGFAVSPGLFEMMEVLGKEVVIRRIDRGLKKIR
jgi:glutamyl-tRNA synthetase